MATNVQGRNTKSPGEITYEVKWFNRLKGHGFAKQEGGPDIFLHYDNIVKVRSHEQADLHEGDRILCDVMDLGKGPIAKNIRLYTGP